MNVACRLFGAIALLISALNVVGCASDEVVAEPVASIASGTWAGQTRGAEVTLSLSKDGRFQTVFRGGKYRSVVRGRAKLQESALLLEATEFNGKPADSKSQEMPVKFTFTPEWTTLTSSDGLTLKRKI
jgi:hypothetical protein